MIPLILMQVTTAHVAFLRKMRDKCLLHERAAVVADTIRKILDLSLTFRTAYSAYYVSFFRVSQSFIHNFDKNNSLLIKSSKSGTDSHKLLLAGSNFGTAKWEWKTNNGGGSGAGS